MGRSASFSIFSLFVVIFIDYTRQWSILIFIFQVEFSELPQLCSNQEETDTRVVLYLHHAVNLGYKNAVVRTPDTDILVILLYHAHTNSLTIYLDTGSGKHRKLINLSDLAAFCGRKLLQNPSRVLCVHGRGLYQLLQMKRKSCASEKAREEPQVS